jgi:hypothetical protein
MSKGFCRRLIAVWNESGQRKPDYFLFACVLLLWLAFLLLLLGPSPDGRAVQPARAWLSAHLPAVRSH